MWSERHQQNESGKYSSGPSAYMPVQVTHKVLTPAGNAEAGSFCCKTLVADQIGLPRPLKAISTAC